MTAVSLEMPDEPNKMGIKKGSSVKCVDAFRIALTEKPELFNKQKYSQDSQLSILLSPSNSATFFHFNTSKI